MRKYLVFAFVAWHLVAIALGSIPPPEQLANFPPRTERSALGPGFDGITAVFDRVTAAGFRAMKAIWWATTPIHELAERYRAVAGVGQSWAMFSNPPQFDEYVRTRYYVRPPRGREWMVTELVSPALREDRVRLAGSFRASYQDKAVAIAFADFFAHRKRELIKPDTRSSELPDDVAPIGRYFARRYAERYLVGTDARIVRIEVWNGRARAPGLGQPRDDAALLDRVAALQSYFEGPIEDRLRVAPYPPYHGGETEADIQWLLEYFEEPR